MSDYVKSCQCALPSMYGSEVCQNCGNFRTEVVTTSTGYKLDNLQNYDKDVLKDSASYGLFVGDRWPEHITEERRVQKILYPEEEYPYLYEKEYIRFNRIGEAEC